MQASVEKREPSDTAGGNVNWCSHYGEQHGSSSKNLKIELPYDPAIPLLGIYWDKTVICKDACTRVFTAALFTIGKLETKCPLTDEWIKMRHAHVYIYTSISISIRNGISLSHLKNNDICSNMDGPRDDHSKSDKEGQIPYDITFMWNLKYDTNEHIYETKTDLQRSPRGLGKARTGSLGLIVCRLLYIGWTNTKALLYSTGNYIQYHVTNHDEK